MGRGMDPENVKEFGLALAGEEALTEYVEAQQAQAEARVAVDPSTLLDDYDLSDSDRAQLARPEVMQIFREATAEWAFNGVGGWVDDDLAFTRPWGFDVSDIAVPVLHLWLGRRTRAAAHGVGWRRMYRAASSRSSRPAISASTRWPRSPRTCAGSKTVLCR